MRAAVVLRAQQKLSGNMQETFDFKRDVVDQSFIRPVLIDFWAEWCGPCKMLGPVLEQLHSEDQGKWDLVKIDTEEYPDIASYFHIQSIPNCKLVFEGKIVDEFSGALSKASVRQWLDKNLSALIVEEVTAEPDDLDELLAEQKSIPDSTFMERLRSFVEAHPENQNAILSLVRHEVFFKPELALSRIEQGVEKKEIQELYEDLQAIRDWIGFEPEQESASGELIARARKYILQGDGQSAMDHLIESLHKDSNYREGLARRAGIALFHFWGPKHPLTLENRKLFDMAIW
jgi:putative thioredoxin